MGEAFLQLPQNSNRIKNHLARFSRNLLYVPMVRSAICYLLFICPYGTGPYDKRHNALGSDRSK